MQQLIFKHYNIFFKSDLMFLMGSWPVTASRLGLWSPTLAPATHGSGNVHIQCFAITARSDRNFPSLPPCNPGLNTNYPQNP